MAVQIIDDENWEPPLKPANTTGAIWNVVPPSARAARPVGEWNSLQIRCEGDAVEVTLNGQRVVQADMSRIAALRDRPRSGFIGLANHKGEARGTAFRRIEIKELSQPTRSPP
jgi:hypothetical protein